MKKLQGIPVIGGKVKGEVMITRQPINFTAAMTKVTNLLPGKKAQVLDRHHELFNHNIANKVLIFPACIGSTHTGLVLLELVALSAGPIAMIVQNNDPLLTSGVVLSKVWYNKSIPLIEYKGDEIFDLLENGDTIEVDGDTGEIFIT
jgi:predicted aconitase with swiveling domain